MEVVENSKQENGFENEVYREGYIRALQHVMNTLADLLGQLEAVQKELEEITPKEVDEQ